MDYQELNLQSGDLLTEEVAKIKIAKLLLRNDTSENWNAANTVLLKGEPAIEFDENNKAKLKIGDGVTAWTDLPYLATEATSGEDIPEGLEERIITLESAIGAFDVRIQNAESGVEAAVLASDEALASVEELRQQITENLETQNTKLSEMEASVQESAAQVEVLETKAAEIQNTQDAQQAEIDTANARVDTLVAGFTDNAEFDNAELLDIRVGYDGITHASAGAAVRQVGYDLKNLYNNLDNALGKDIVDGLSYEGNKLYLTANGEQVGEAVTIVGGGGGGSLNQTYTITLMNLLDSRSLVITDEDECILEFSYHSIDEDSYNDGPGIGYIFVNNSQVATTTITQGNNSFNITSHLAKGENSIKIQVENSEGARKTLTYTVNVLVLSVTTTAPKMGLYSGMTSLPYTVTGAGTKTVHFIMDGREIAQETVTTSGNSRVFVVPEQADGAHILQIYAEVPNGLLDTIKSNLLEVGMLYYSSTTTTQAILMMNYEGPQEVEEGTTLVFPYMVYDPFLQTTDISLNIYDEENNLYSTFPLQVDQSPKEWVTQNYPSGQIKFEIICKDASVSQTIAVKETSFDKEVITDSCILDFSARGRSNNESNPAHWEYNDVTAEFSGFGWANIDGWMDIKDKETGAIKGQALRFLPGNTMMINHKPFAQDFRVNGYTIEAEFETHNVRDYDSIIISSFNEGRGFIIKSQSASLSSELSNVSLQFKEDSRVRVTFVVEQLSLYRFVYIYVNGVMCGAIQYPENDDFAQPEPVIISIGAESCGLDLYTLRMYNKGLTRYEQLNNFICDRPTLAERIEADNRNNVLNSNNAVDIANLPMNIPYIILECEELPQFKGDKKKEKSVTYIEPLHPERNFTATGVQLDVQGTSSAGYPIKNYKVSLKNGLFYSNSGETAEGFPIFAGGLEGKNICLKADFASSEQANNVCLVDYYEQLSPYKTPAQEQDERVRTGVRGFPCMVFWRNTTTNETTFVGKYNFNDDKSNENVFGFNRDIYPNCECWELCNNTSDRVLFNRSEYEEWGVDEDNNPIEAWRLDFEPRFPDLDEPYKDYTQLKRLTDWIVSTNRSLVDTEEEKAARLQKFKDEFETYFIKEAMIFYYLFTEVFILADSRAKNMFLTTFNGTHWFPIPYDMDTACGINNEGNLVFEYDLEDTDTPNGANVFTGQNSALWHNVRDAFANEIRVMYQNLRSGTLFNYETINNKMRDHQSIWPEAIWNEDEYNKYIGSFIDKNENYLEMLQGDKKAQRDWWLYNGFKYRDSKYNAGDALTNFITLRCYEVGNITITPYSNICPRIKYGSVYAGGERIKRNVPTELVCTQDEMDDTEVYIYSADRLASVGDLSHLKVGLAVFSAATKLQEIVLGSAAEGYTNPNLYSLEVGNNELLTLINVTNCNSDKFTNLDVSGCHGLETVLAKGTKLTGINLPNGGHLTTLELPETIANLTVQNQKNIQTLNLESQENLSTLRIEGTPGLPIETLINNSPKLNRVRLTNVEWNATNEETLSITIDKLINSKGLDANGLNLDKAIVTGRVHIAEISDTFLEYVNDHFPELVVVVNGVAQYFVRYADWDNTLLYRYIAEEGTTAIDPIEEGYIEVPYREETENAKYTYKGWSERPEKIYRPYSIIAQYSGEYRVLFYDLEGNVVSGGEQWVKEGESATDPVAAGLSPAPKKESTAQYDYFFSGWDLDFTYIDGTNLIFYPVFREELRSYPVYFYNDNIKVQESRVFYGDVAIFTGDTTQIFKMIGGEASPYYEFIGWNPDPTQPIVGVTRYEAQFAFDGYIEEDWETIAENCKNSNIGHYGLGGRKQLTFTLAGIEATVEMEIVGKNHDNLAEISSDYNGGSSTAALTFIARVLRPEIWNMNSSIPEWNTEGEIYPFPPETDEPAGYNWGGWSQCNMRKKLDQELFGQLPAILQTNIKPVIKLSDHGRYFQDILAETTDKIWLPSALELGSTIEELVAASGQGKTYPVYNIDSSRIKETSNGNRTSYWTRSSSRDSSHQFRYIDINGYIGGQGGSSSMAIAFGFCL